MEQFYEDPVDHSKKGVWKAGVWRDGTNTAVSEEPIVAQNSADETSFTLEELKAALKAAKSNKPAPDGGTMELVKCFDDESSGGRFDRLYLSVDACFEVPADLWLEWFKYV